MRKIALAGAVALAAVGSSLVKADEISVSNLDATVASPSGVVITSSHVARLKAALKLTEAQEQYWRPVEVAFHQMAQRQQDDAVGIVQRLRRRAAAVTVDAMNMRRLAAAALPLLKSLDEDQKRVALAFARSIGMGQLAAAL